jgi:hypothetical protein
MDRTAEIETLIVESLESAGMSGLCREGCLELAVDRLRQSHPEIDNAAAWALVNAVSERVDKNTERGG